MKRPPRAPLPLATLVLAVTILAVFAVELAGDAMGLCQRFGLVPARPSFGATLASPLLHDTASWSHVGGNVAVLVLVGTPVERAIGSMRFVLVYFAGGLAGASLHIIVDPTSTVPLVGASGSLFAVLAVAATLFGPGMLAFAAVLVATNVWRALGGPSDEAVSFGCHLGGFAAGAAVVMLARLCGVELRHTVTA